jgi:2-C-methyl-D-erythritol 4-phosphate cytidylyltransferase
MEVRLVIGASENFKITTPQDLARATELAARIDDDVLHAALPLRSKS